jgi:hypothetical protein
MKRHRVAKQHPPSKGIKSEVLDDSARLSQPATRCAEIVEGHVIAKAEIHRSKEGILVAPSRRSMPKARS